MRSWAGSFMMLAVGVVLALVAAAAPAAAWMPASVGDKPVGGGQLSASSGGNEWAVPVTKSSSSEIIPDDQGGVWTRVGRAGRLVHVAADGKNEIIDLPSSKIRNNTLYSNGAGGVLIGGLFYGRVIEVLFNGTQRPLPLPCTVSNAVSDGARGVWASCEAPALQYLHYDLATDAVRLFSAGTQHQGIMVLSADSVGGAWAALEQAGRQYRLASIDTSGVLKEDVVTYHDVPDYSFPDGHISVLEAVKSSFRSFRLIAPGFGSEQTVPRGFNEFGTDCLSPRGSVCAATHSIVRWVNDRRAWRLQDHPWSYPCGLVNESVRRDGSASVGCELTRRGKQYWRITPKGRAYHLGSPREVNPEYVSSGKVAWSVDPKGTLYRVLPRRMHWKRSDARVQSITIPEWNGGQVILPSRSDQGSPLTWKVAPKSSCKLTGRQLDVRGLSCRASVTAPGRGSYARLGLAPVFNRVAD